MTVSKRTHHIQCLPPLIPRGNTMKFSLFKKPFSVREYWNNRYLKGGNSGDGSYGQLAAFKADILNEFIRTHNITSISEFGCGDGNQLSLIEIGHYTGYDISDEAVRICRQKYANSQFEFHNVTTYDGRKADMALSLDVIYHLVDDEIYHNYMSLLFSASDKFAGIYAWNINWHHAEHVKSRRFFSWIYEHAPQWQLAAFIPNRYPDISNSDFYFFSRQA